MPENKTTHLDPTISLLRTDVVALYELLAEIEWSATSWPDGSSVCPICGAEYAPHEAWCDLAPLLELLDRLCGGEIAESRPHR